ncbi:MAG TPA: hypothetical protein PKD26_11320 [Pyrinomonadaceae bacterium]|nr:hypothetical protein [Pyrinomonadaceae bacterium]
MSDEAVKAAEEAGTESAKPTITIAEKEAPGADAEPVQLEAPAAEPEAPPAHDPEDVHYQAVEKDGVVTAIWEMQGQKHLRTIAPRSNEGKQILALFETAG